MLSKEDIIEKKLCITCGISICYNDYNQCIYRNDPDIQLCTICKDSDFETVDGVPKCYHTCIYRKYKKVSLNKYFKMK